MGIFRFYAVLGNRSVYSVTAKHVNVPSHTLILLLPDNIGLRTVADHTHFRKLLFGTDPGRFWARSAQ